MASKKNKGTLTLGGERIKAKLNIDRFRLPPYEDGWSYVWSLTAYYPDGYSIRYTLRGRQQWATVDECFVEAALFGFTKGED